MQILHPSINNVARLGHLTLGRSFKLAVVILEGYRIIDRGRTTCCTSRHTSGWPPAGVTQNLLICLATANRTIGARTVLLDAGSQLSPPSGMRRREHNAASQLRHNRFAITGRTIIFCTGYAAGSVCRRPGPPPHNWPAP